MKKIIGYIAGGIALLFVAGLIFSEEFRMEMKLIWITVTGSTIDKLELQLDQGELALSRYDQAVRLQQNKLAKLYGVIKDAEMGEKKNKEKAADYRKEGKEDLALRHEEAAKKCREQANLAGSKVEKMEESLKKVKNLRERARADVNIARQNIATLKTMEDALDDSGIQELLDKAEQNVTNLQSQCNQIEAEIEVLSLTD
ncbi:MAG: hypothetical protein E7031_07425 [Akkermansiaceae bacterium]|nr:hypothetical protein [Akkermansiaceae bacterium]